MRDKETVHIVQKYSDDFNYLSDISPRDKPWDNHKANADKVSSLYEQVNDQKRALRLNKCGKYLEFFIKSEQGFKDKLKLVNANSCHVRTCPVCQWRRSLVWRARLHQAIPLIFENRQNYQLLFLTLTVKNCDVNDLKSEINKLNKAWKKLFERKAFPGVGWIKSLEVTRGKDNTAHPHLHCIVMVSPKYFVSKQYLSQEKWTNLWQKSLKVDYKPIVDVRKVRYKNQPNDIQFIDKDSIQSHNQRLKYALMEIFKYSIKESDLTANAEWLKSVTKQLRNVRAIALGGVFKQYMSQDEPEDLTHLENEDIEIVEKEVIILFKWINDEKRYRSI